MILLLRNSTTCFRSMKGLKRNLRQPNLLKNVSYFIVLHLIYRIYSRSWLTLKWKEIEPRKEGILGDTLRPCRAKERERLVSTDTPLWLQMKWEKVKIFTFYWGEPGKKVDLSFFTSAKRIRIHQDNILDWFCKHLICCTSVTSIFSYLGARTVVSSRLDRDK